MKLVAAVFTILILSAAAMRATPVPTISGDFTANITLNEAGIKYHGYIISDVTGQRTFRYVKELNETTYIFQSWGEATTYTYTIMNSGCTCQIAQSATITNMFGSLVTAVQSTKGCNSTYGSGTLFANDWLTKLPATPAVSYCVTGTTPSYVQMADRVVVFSNFKSGRPETFPLEPMNSWQDECSSACL
jgi:hypothetical protein